SIGTQANGGTALPCRVAYVAGGITSLTAVTPSVPVKMNIGAAASSLVGIMIPTPTPGTAYVDLVASAPGIAAPMEIPIDDVSKLYFWASVSAGVNILYRR
ncbi:hypothetical protein LCGC14_2163480, partial [marine sediment metagenome]